MKQVFYYEAPDTQDEQLKVIVQACAACTHNYGSERCHKCTCNPALYTDKQTALKLRTAACIRQSTIASYRSRQAHSTAIVTVVIIAVVIGFLYLLRVTNMKHVKELQAQLAIAHEEFEAETRPKPKVETKPKSNIADIEARVQQALYRVRDNISDINVDGLVNCKDYCLLFITYYPTAQIVYNPHIGETGHVFIRVPTSEGWLYIEPQLTKNWYARDAWYGSYYNDVKQYNEIVSKRWLLEW